MTIRDIIREINIRVGIAARSMRLMGEDGDIQVDAFYRGKIEAYKEAVTILKDYLRYERKR